MDDVYILLWAVGIVMFLGIGSIIALGIDEIFFTPTKDEMCQSIGMKESLYMSNANYCIDYNSEAHFVNIKCKGFMTSKKCTAQIISIGDLRVR